jgi:hypothetical protein
LYGNLSFNSISTYAFLLNLDLFNNKKNKTSKIKRHSSEKKRAFHNYSRRFQFEFETPQFILVLERLRLLFYLIHVYKKKIQKVKDR